MFLRVCKPTYFFTHSRPSHGYPYAHHQTTSGTTMATFLLALAFGLACAAVVLLRDIANTMRDQLKVAEEQLQAAKELQTALSIMQHEMRSADDL